ncbi:gspL periplasmic domain protein, partial [Vibrio parahaemolyticus V-223/04]
VFSVRFSQTRIEFRP